MGETQTLPNKMETLQKIFEPDTGGLGSNRRLASSLIPYEKPSKPEAHSQRKTVRAQSESYPIKYSLLSPITIPLRDNVGNDPR